MRALLIMILAVTNIQPPPVPIPIPIRHKQPSGRADMLMTKSASTNHAPHVDFTNIYYPLRYDTNLVLTNYTWVIEQSSNMVDWFFFCNGTNFNTPFTVAKHLPHWWYRAKGSL
jgi:hypothetical protein